MKYLLFILFFISSQLLYSQVLTSNGRAEAEVILMPNPDLRERLAARELLFWLQKITKAKLPLLALPSNDKNRKIFIGKKWAQNLFPEDLKALKGTGGYAVREKGDNIYIFGAKPAGTLFGVWKFLEKNTDIIWSRPNTEYGAVFTVTPNLTLTETNFRHKPTFWFRSWAGPGGVPDYTTNLWKARNGGAPQSTVRLPMRGSHYIHKEMGGIFAVGGGFMHGFLGKYMKTRPDFFPLIDGKRVISRHAQPCLSNPDVSKTLIYEAKKMLANAPEETIMLNCSNEDTWRSCECEKCLAPITLKDGSKLSPKSVTSEGDQLFRSTQTYMFLNKLAENLEKDYPGLPIQTLTYIYAAEPPAVKVHPSIMTLYCPYSTRNIRFPIHDATSKHPCHNWAKRFEEWKKQPSILALYEYYGLRYFNAIAETSAIDLRELAQAGGVGITSCETLQDVETSHYGFGRFSDFWDTTGMELWVISSLLWDPNQNVADLRDYYYKRTFREAAPEMKNFFAVIGKNWHDKNRKGVETCHSSSSGAFNRYIVIPGDEKVARAHLTSALKMVKHPDSKILIKRILSRFDDLAAKLGRLMIPSIPEAFIASKEFASPHWLKALVLKDFQLPRKYKRPHDPQNKTELRIMRDDKNLYFKIYAFDSKPGEITVIKKADKECFPLGERFDILLRNGTKGDTYLFSFDLNGNKYDAKEWNGQWNSNWSVKGSKTKNGWQAIVTIPIDDIKNKKGKISLEGLFSRINKHESNFKEESTYKGSTFSGYRMHPLNFK
ncbi:MAG: DUF4838 domain-containing protein [Verrucomicrobiota bacterium]|nr:DUF4838 domain-containing protein [Verrucomicrobiota bacterium]